MIHRCAWAQNSELEAHYHDTEWGVPVHDDRKFFEFMILDGFQAGLSWITILKKREHFRAVMDHFDVQKVARYGAQKKAELLQDRGIIRNRLKIEATVTNAQAFIALQEEHGSFDAYIWDFVDGTPVTNTWTSRAEVPATSPLSDRISKDLKKRGFKFVGSTIIYAFLQAAGLVNDHEVSCHRYAAICAMAKGNEG